MDNFDGQSLPAYHSAQEILAHPRFSAARLEFVRGYLGLYEHNPFLNRLLLEVGRNILFVVIMCLHARYDEDDRATWPTLRLVTQETTAQGVASARRIPGLVERLVETGYLESRPSPRDRRIRIIAPTATMMAEDRDWLVSHYLPLQTLFPEPGYPGIMQRDPAFQIAQRLIASSFFALGARILAEHPIMMRFMTREAGMIILIKLIQLCDPESLATPEGVSYSDFGARFGVSRTRCARSSKTPKLRGLCV